MAEFVPTLSKCNTCMVAFEHIESVREHYRTDWHVMNSRRRGNHLPPVTFEEFRRMQKKGATKSTAAPRERTTPSATVQSILKANIANSSSSSVAAPAPAPAANEEEEEDQRKDAAKDEENEGPEFIELPIDPTISLFSANSFETTEECITHMLKGQRG